jgi:hypothetical protein
VQTQYPPLTSQQQQQAAATLAQQQFLQQQRDLYLAQQQYQQHRHSMHQQYSRYQQHYLPNDPVQGTSSIRLLHISTVQFISYMTFPLLSNFLCHKMSILYTKVPTSESFFKTIPLCTQFSYFIQPAAYGAAQLSSGFSTSVAITCLEQHGF